MNKEDNFIIFQSDNRENVLDKFIQKFHWTKCMKRMFAGNFFIFVITIYFLGFIICETYLKLSNAHVLQCFTFIHLGRSFRCSLLVCTLPILLCHAAARILPQLRSSSKGPFKKYVTQNIEICYSLPPCHT